MNKSVSQYRSLLVFFGVVFVASAFVPVKAWLSSSNSTTAASLQGSGYQIVVGETPVNNTAQKQLSVKCPSGKKATGAGWSVLDPTSAILEGESTYSEPAFDGSSWMVNAKNKSTFSPKWKLRVRLICAVISS
jgi:hypothetical protein